MNAPIFISLILAVLAASGAAVIFRKDQFDPKVRTKILLGLTGLGILTVLRYGLSGNKLW